MDSTDLYYYGARFYDPTLGRFINMDPAKDGGNWWVYVNNNPLKYVDPDGLEAKWWNPFTWDFSWLNPSNWELEVADFKTDTGYSLYDGERLNPIHRPGDIDQALYIDLDIKNDSIGVGLGMMRATKNTSLFGTNVKLLDAGVVSGIAPDNFVGFKAEAKVIEYGIEFKIPRTDYGIGFDVSAISVGYSLGMDKRNPEYTELRGGAGIGTIGAYGFVRRYHR